MWALGPAVSATSPVKSSSYQTCLAPPPAVSYGRATEIGDEEWMTDSLLRQNSQQGSSVKVTPTQFSIVAEMEGAPSETFVAAPMSKSSSSRLIYSPPSSAQNYQSLSRRANSQRPHFSTFLDEDVRSETSSISVALLNAYTSPHYDSDIASNTGTLNKRDNRNIQ